MDAKELRIGNWVQRLKEDGTLLMYYNVVKLRDIDGSNEINGLIDYFMPISLEKLWLDKFGFKRTKNDCGWRYRSLHITDGGNIKGPYGTLIVKKGIIRYVHQLQNLYFALTGEELQLK